MVITKYFTGAVAGKWKRTSVSFHVQSLRSFFRYASSRGWGIAGIAESIDAPRLYTYENLPQGPSWEEVKNLVTSVNSTSPVQIRSRCAILLCAVYGLRVGEAVAASRDIDWSRRENLCASLQTEESPNLSPDERSRECTAALSERGQAAVRAHREVLLTLRRPYRPVSVGALSTMTQKLQKRLGLKLKRYGSHVLRHLVPHTFSPKV